MNLNPYGLYPPHWDAGRILAFNAACKRVQHRKKGTIPFGSDASRYQLQGPPRALDAATVRPFDEDAYWRGVARYHDAVVTYIEASRERREGAALAADILAVET